MGPQGEMSSVCTSTLQESVVPSNLHVHLRTSVSLPGYFLFFILFALGDGMTSSPGCSLTGNSCWTGVFLKGRWPVLNSTYISHWI